MLNFYRTPETVISSEAHTSLRPTLSAVLLNCAGIRVLTRVPDFVIIDARIVEDVSPITVIEVNKEIPFRSHVRLRSLTRASALLMGTTVLLESATKLNVVCSATQGDQSG